MKGNRTSLELKKDELVRFYNDEKQEGNFSWEKSDIIPKHLKKETNKKKGPRFGGFKVFPENHVPNEKKILDPGSDVFLKWNRIFLMSCLVALFVDPLFFYLPSVHNEGGSSCMATDLNLGIVVTCFRTVADMFYLLHMFIKLRTAYVSP